MELNENAQVDPGQIDDRRGGGFGGGRLGIPLPTGRGGLIGTIIAVLVALGGGYAGFNALDGGSGGAPASDCSTANLDRTQQTDCRNELYVESIQDFWQDEMPRALGHDYAMAKTEFFSGQTDTGCGPADSGVGPFYCPADNRVYIDLSFYDQLATDLGAPGAFAQPYVLAHEYGRHVQDLVGTEAAVDRARQRDPGDANRLSVMLELQADCYAGVWAKHASSTTDTHGTPIFKSITQQDIQDAVQAAGAVGDDAIQQKMGGGVDESAFTHGSSAQREHWLMTGYNSGDPKSCDTFGGALS